MIIIAFFQYCVVLVPTTFVFCTVIKKANLICYRCENDTDAVCGNEATTKIATTKRISKKGGF